MNTEFRFKLQVPREDRGRAVSIVRKLPVHADEKMFSLGFESADVRSMVQNILAAEGIRAVNIEEGCYISHTARGAE